MPWENRYRMNIGEIGIRIRQLMHLMKMRPSRIKKKYHGMSGLLTGVDCIKIGNHKGKYFCGKRIKWLCKETLVDHTKGCMVFMDCRGRW